MSDLKGLIERMLSEVDVSDKLIGGAVQALMTLERDTKNYLVTLRRAMSAIDALDSKGGYPAYPGNAKHIYDTIDSLRDLRDMCAPLASAYKKKNFGKSSWTNF